MSHISMKNSIIWNNIGEIAIQNGKMNNSVYKSVHFTAQAAISSWYCSTDYNVSL